MDEVTIRRAVIADLEAVGALLQDLDDSHRGALPWLLRRVDGPPLTDFLEAYVSKPRYTPCSWQSLLKAPSRASSLHVPAPACSRVK